MDDNYWEPLLDDLYRAGGYAEHAIDETDEEIPPNLDIEKITGFSLSGISSAARTLSDAELIQYEETVSKDGRYDKSNRRMFLKLKPDGFRVAYQRSIERRQQKRDERQRNQQIRANRSTAAATVGLLVATGLSLLSNVYSQTGDPTFAKNLTWASLLILLVISVGIIWFLFQK